MTDPSFHEHLQRIANVPEINVLQSASETVFDKLVSVAAQLCDAPLALLVMTGEDRRWVKARAKLDEAAIHRATAFCITAITNSGLQVIPDATANPRLARHPAVHAEPRIHFFAGAPLRSAGGRLLGALCVVDHAPRELAAPVRRAFSQLADVVTTVLNLQEQLLARMIDDARFRAIFEQEPECVKLVAEDRTLLEMNPAGLRMIEADSLEQVRGQDVAALVAEADRDAYRGFHERVFSGELGTLEFNMVGLKGRMRRMESHASPVRGSTGEVVAALCLTLDVTERRQQEEHQLRAQRMENLGLLAAGVAHDLNNILTPVMMTAHLLKSHVAPPQHHLLGLLEQSADRGAALVRRILAFAQGVDAERQVIDIRPVARDIANLVEETFPRLIAFKVSIPADLWQVRASPAQVHQVLLNLCVNARDAMPRGGHLGMTLANRELGEREAAAIPGARPGRFVVLSVSDTGGGIPAELLPKIWEPFFTTKPKGRGTGLGLSTVRRIIGTHEGFCEVANRPGTGVTFHVHLPAAASKPGTRPATAPADVPHGQDQLVLLVEDEPNIAATAHTALTGHGYRVVTASDGVEAIELVAQHHDRIALALVDRHLPRIGGDEIASLFRRQYPRLRVMMMSGGSGGDEPGGPPEGILVLPKPFTPQELLRAVHGALGSG